MSYNITVNARRWKWIKDSISYEEVVAIATDMRKRVQLLTVIYARQDRKGADANGTLVPDESTNVTEGMHFTAIATGNA